MLGHTARQKYLDNNIFNLISKVHCVLTSKYNNMTYAIRYCNLVFEGQIWAMGNVFLLQLKALNYPLAHQMS